MIRVLLVDDHVVFLARASRWLQDLPSIELVGQALSGDEGIVLAVTLKPDLVLMDVSMPGISGCEAAAIIRSRADAPKVICITVHPLDLFEHDCGTYADAFLSKADLFTDLQPLIESVCRPEEASA